MPPHPLLLTPLLRDLPCCTLVYHLLDLKQPPCFFPFFSEEISCAEIRIDRKEYFFRFRYVVVWIINPATTNSIPRRQ